MQQWSSASDPSRAYKHFYKEQLDQFVRQKQQQKQLEHQREEEEKRRYNDRLAQYNQMERLKDQTYKNYYQELMVNQQKRGEQYVSPFSEREMMKAQHVENALREQKIRDKEIDAQRTYREQIMRESFRNGLKYQVDGKKAQDNISKEQRFREIQLLEMNSLSPKQVDQLQMIRRKQAEAKYKQDLDKIVSEKEQAHIRTIRQEGTSFYPAQSSTEHNPLFNPLPFNIQNPYILREFRRRSQSTNSSYLAGVANNSLTEHV